VPDATVRERLAAILREEPAAASELARRYDLPRSAVHEHLRHVARSVDGDERFLVAPPECGSCGFSAFDDPLGDPSRCPDCRSEDVADAVFRIE